MPALVLVHGFLSRASCWDCLIPHIHNDQVIRIVLPGHGDAGNISFSRPQDLAESLAQQVPDGSLWLGWSLGGLLAQYIASLTPHKVSHLVCLCALPRFVSGDGWEYGLAPQSVDDFRQTLRADPVSCARRFIGLQLLGDSDIDMTRNRLQQHSVALSERGQSKDTLKELDAALQFLVDTDLRDALQSYPGTIDFIAGENDQITQADGLGAASRLVQHGRYHSIKGGSHALPLSSPQQIARIIEQIEWHE